LWLNQALEKEGDHAAAMTIATVDQSGCPSSRVVLLKEFSENGFVFYTKYDSEKGSEIAVNPNVALSFFWGSLERQVRIKGVATKIDTNESDEYFLSRPLDSQLAAHASPQSQVIPDRAFLEKKVVEYKELFSIEKMKRPDNWGGYCVVPKSIEFWQGRSGRLHDRLKYSLRDNVWVIERLGP